MEKYALSIVYKSSDWFGKIRHFASVIEANSEDEAIGKAHKMMRRELPGCEFDVAIRPCSVPTDPERTAIREA